MMKTQLEVEGGISVRESVKKAFGEAGYEAVLAAGGLEDVARLLANEIDVVLLDIGLPNQGAGKTWPHLASQQAEAPMHMLRGQPRQITSTLLTGAFGLTERPLNSQQPPPRIQLLLARSGESHARAAREMAYYAGA
jgi:DNA-binding response OmpR family regulator